MFYMRLFKLKEDTQSITDLECQNPTLWARDQGKGAGRWRAKREIRESLHMLPRVQRVLGNEPSHSQMNSHVGSWSPKWTPECYERNCRGQNPLPQRVHYIMGKLLKRRCLK
jgi:hypothetical protein